MGYKVWVLTLTLMVAVFATISSTDAGMAYQLAEGKSMTQNQTANLENEKKSEVNGTIFDVGIYATSIANGSYYVEVGEDRSITTWRGTKSSQ